MDYFKKLGISYSGDYIKQGSNMDKCEKSENLSAKYTEIYVRKDGKESNIEDLKKVYKGRVFFHLPTLRHDLTNLKSITNTVIDLVKGGVKYAIIDVSNLPLDIYEWSTVEEQEDYIRTLSNGYAQIISNGITLYIENSSDEKGTPSYGSKVEHISDLIMYTKNALFKNYDFTKERVESSIGVSFDITKLYDDVGMYYKWFNVLGNNIKLVKVSDVDNAISIFDGILSSMMSNEIEPILLLKTDNEIEEINKKYRKFEYLINIKNNGGILSLDSYSEINIKDSKTEYNYNISSQSGYSSIVIISMIIITIIVAVIMLYIKFKN